MASLSGFFDPAEFLTNDFWKPGSGEAPLDDILGLGPTEYPEMSPEERALLETQTDLLDLEIGNIQDNNALKDQLQPILLEQLGIKPVYSERSANPEFAKLQQQLSTLRTQLNGGTAAQQNTNVYKEVLARSGDPAAAEAASRQAAYSGPEALRSQIGDLEGRLANTPEFTGGELTGYEKMPLSESDQQIADLRDQIELGLLERTQKALTGELDVSPALLKDLGQQEGQLREQLRRNLGEGFETSSAGIEALSQFDQQKNLVLEEARRGQISDLTNLGFQAGTSQALMKSQQMQDLFSGVGQVVGSTSISEGFNSASAIGQAFANERLNAFNTQLQDQANNRETAGAGIGILASIFSSKQFKVDLGTYTVLNAFRNTPCRLWRYKGQNVQHPGPYAEDFTQNFGLGNGRTINIIDYLGVLFAGIKEIIEVLDGRLQKRSSS